MHPHNLTVALAEARAADLRRAATPTTPTAPPRRDRGTFAFLALAAIAAAFAFAPTGAFAQPADNATIPATAHPDGAPASLPVQDLRTPDARDAADGRGTYNSPDVVVVKAQPQTQPAAKNGIDWADGGIGAGSALAITLLALGAALFITHRRREAHETIAPGAR